MFYQGVRPELNQTINYLKIKTQNGTTKRTSLLLNKDPRNPWLRGKLMTENKEYKRLIKFKQKQFTDNLFNELETMHCKDPHAYMELVKALRDGKHDRSKPSDLKEIEPDTWFEIFPVYLGGKLKKN